MSACTNGVDEHWQYDEEVNSYTNEYSTYKEKSEEFAEEIDIFISTINMQIHEDMPEFTFHRIIGELVLEGYWIDIPSPREVSIIIEDEDGNIIQEIFGLTQTDWQAIEASDITFEDLNFNGYLDMRLKRYQHGVGGLLADEYFWLWDAERAQFVLNEQLMAVGQAGLSANSETQQIETWARMSRGGYFGFYEWRYGELVQVMMQTEEFVWHGEDGPWYFQSIETDVITGDAITTITPTDRYGNLLD